MSLSKTSKMLQFINYRMRVTTDDRRTLVGRFMAFDKHMNVVLADCEEFRRTKKSDKEERRALGFVLLRGECVVSIAVESAPAPKKQKGKRSAAAAGLPEAPLTRKNAPTGLAGPLAALGPQLSATPRMYPQQPPTSMYGRNGSMGVNVTQQYISTPRQTGIQQAAPYVGTMVLPPTHIPGSSSTTDQMPPPSG